MINSIENAVRNRINWLENNSGSNLLISKLRRLNPSQNTDIELYTWMFGGSDSKLADKINNSDQYTNEEWAIMIPLILYSMNSPRKLSKNQMSFAKALGKTVKTQEDVVRLSRRLESLSKTRDIQLINRQLQQLFRYLKPYSNKVNYPELARDLYMFLDSETRQEIQKKWGTEFTESINFSRL